MYSEFAQYSVIELLGTIATRTTSQNFKQLAMSKATGKKTGGNAASKKQESVSKGSITSFFCKPNSSSSSSSASANVAVEQPVTSESPPVVQQENIGNEPIAMYHTANELWSSKNLDY